MGYLDGSSLDEATDGLTPPTMEEFMEKAGEPVLSFSINETTLEIPKGILNCCRVLHQPHCDAYVAGTLIGCLYTLRMPDGVLRERVPEKQSLEGDRLYDYVTLANAIQVTWLMVKATAESLGATIEDIRFMVWTFNLADWEAWRFLRQEQERESAAALAEMDGMGIEQIRALDTYILTGDEAAPDSIARLMTADDFHSVVGYADRMEVFPSEIGHDDSYRYMTTVVWGGENEVPPAVEALNEVPEAEEQPCQPATAST